MALENAGGEAGRVFVQLGGGTAEFQGRKTALVAHDEIWGRVIREIKKENERRRMG